MTAQQLREAFPWDSAPRYLLRDRDRIFGHEFVEQAKAMGINRYCQHRVHAGSALRWNVVSAPSAASASITLSFSTKAAYDSICKISATTIIGVAPIWACKRTRQRRALSNHRKLVELSPFQKLVACIIATNVAPP